MGFLTLIQSSIAKYLLIAASIFSLILFGAFELHSLESKYDKQGYNRAKSEDVEQLLKQEKQSQLITQTFQSKLNKAQNERTIAENKLYDISKSNDVAINQLRQQLDSFNSGMPIDSRSTLSNRIATISTLFAECTQRYSDLAEQADKQSYDIKVMKESWPK